MNRRPLSALGACLALIASLPAAAAYVSLAVSNPYCARAEANSKFCILQLRSSSATGSDTSFQSLDVAIDGKLRVHVNGFFETSAYLNQGMLDHGLVVACGAGMGLMHSALTTASMYAGPTDTASVLCPAASDVIFANGFQ